MDNNGDNEYISDSEHNTFNKVSDEYFFKEQLIMLQNINSTCVHIKNF
jgi:hypothetical protein